MKKLLVCSVMVLCLCTTGYAACSHSGGHHSGGHHSSGCHHNGHSHNGYHSGSSGNSQPVYLVKQDFLKSRENFQNCDKHYMSVETIVNHYSDGTTRTLTNCTVFNTDGSVLVSGCRSVKHILYDKKHYFIICKNGCYLMDGEGNKISKRTYSRMDEFKPNRLIVKLDKRYGIIDLNENVIVPIKYQKFIVDGNGIFITKLNGYWGILDAENNVLVKNDCDRIKSVNDAILLKRYHKYGLADLDGKILYDIKYDKIKKLGEYILVKEGKKFFVLDSDGERINDFSYKKIKLERNNLYGYTDDSKWIELK